MEMDGSPEQGTWYWVLGPAGVGLVVLPPAGGWGRATAAAVLEGLGAAGIRDVDEARVVEAVQAASGESVTVAPPQQPRPRDGWMAVAVDLDGMRAQVRVFPPQGGRPLTVVKAEGVLRLAGVRAGIDRRSLAEAVEACDPLHPVVVARGVPPQDGEDAQVEFHFRVREGPLRPAETEDGRVDFYNLNLVENVKAGQVLATKTPARPGRPGYKVTGEELPARPGKDVGLSAGQNVAVSPDGLTLTAAKDGHAFRGLQGRVTVLPVFEVRGNVDLSTGNIDCVGSVVVRGNVESGLRVVAQRDVEVYGCVDGGMVRAGGDVLVKRGIQGRGRGGVEAQGNVSALFVQNARVSAGGRVEVGEAIMHSQVVAGEKVEVRGRKGLIVGGMVRAGEEVSARVVGSPYSTPTQIEVGVDPRSRQELAELLKSLAQASTDLEETRKGVRLYQEAEKAQGSLPPGRREALLRLLRQQSQLRRTVAELAERRQRLEAEAREQAGGRVKVSGVVYPGVRIVVGTAALTVRDEIPRASFSLSPEGEVAIGPL
ncbi:MAG: FapA family protein [Acetobacteraceae bacterium]|nr:FapA family protein [Acetobacteraceae bacterium]